MDFTDYFLNIGWICIKDASSKEVLDILEFEEIGDTTFEEGYEIIQMNYDQPKLLSFKVNNYLFLLGKFYFSSLELIEELIKEVSNKFKSIYCFGLDIWSDFHCLIKHEDGSFKEVYWKNDGVVNSIGEIAKSKFEKLTSDEKTNLILDLSEIWTVSFTEMEDIINKEEFDSQLIQKKEFNQKTQNKKQ